MHTGSPLTTILYCTAISTTLGAHGSASQLAPDYYTRDLPLIIELFEIDDSDRQQILYRLLKDYDTSNLDLVLALKNDTSSIYATTTGMDTVLQNLARTEAFLNSRVALAKDLESDITTVLEGEEVAAWGGLMRDLRRQRQLPHGRLIVEDLDISKLVLDQRLNLPGLVAADVDLLVEKWKLAVDAAILKREPLIITGNVVYRQLVNETRFREAHDIISSLIDSRAALRDLNLDTARKIGDLLPPEEQSSWRREMRRASGQMPLNKSLVAAWRRLSEHPSCLDSGGIKQVESLRLFEADTLDLADAIMVIRIAKEELGLRAPSARRLGLFVDRESLDDEYMNLLLRLRGAQSDAAQRLCATMNPDCCQIFRGDEVVFQIPSVGPQGANNPSVDTDEPPSPHGDPLTPPYPDPPYGTESPDETPPHPMPPSPASRDTPPPPGMEPPTGPEPPDPF